MDQLRAELVPMLAQAFAAVMAVLVPWATQKAVAFLRERIETERYERAMIRLTDAVSDAVEELAQTVVDGLKDDGRFDAEEAEEVRRAALGQAKHNLGPKALEEVRRALELQDLRELDRRIVSKIEAEVRRTKGLRAISLETEED